MIHDNDNEEDIVSGARDEAELKAIRGAVGGVLCNARNFPDRVGLRVLGADMGPLIDRTVDAVLAALSTQPAATTVEDARAEAHRRFEPSKLIEDYDGDRYVDDEGGTTSASVVRSSRVPSGKHRAALPRVERTRMSDEYAPTTAEVRDAYAQAKWETFGSDVTTVQSDANEARWAFDRWLDAHDTEEERRQTELDAQIADKYADIWAAQSNRTKGSMSETASTMSQAATYIATAIRAQFETTDD